MMAMESNQQLAISPSGHLHLSNSDSKHEIAASFAASQEAGLLALAAARSTESWPAELIFWREFIAAYIGTLCREVSGDSAQLAPIPLPVVAWFDSQLLRLPPMLGAEYVTAQMLAEVWRTFDNWVRAKISQDSQGLNGFLAAHLPLWQQVGRVCFHLAENKRDPDYPFAFLATYAPRIGNNARIQYQPLNKALQEYAGEGNKKALLQLLKPVHIASQHCAWVQDLLQSHDIYHPLAWKPEEALTLLKSVAQLEDAGLVVRLPDWWKKRPRARVQVTIGNTQKTAFGKDALLDFDVAIALNGKVLSQKELAALQNAEDGLVFIRGQWVEVDQEKLAQALNHWTAVEAGVAAGGFSFIEGMRLLAGADADLTGVEQVDDDEQSWAYVDAGNWLKDILQGLRQPDSLATQHPGSLLKAQLRPYQLIGVNWLRFLTELGLGACLADDMGLGKTIQVIALLLIKQKQRKKTAGPSLLVLPASLLSNWKAELARFAPSLKALYVHASEMSRMDLDELASNRAAQLRGCDLVLTTYGMVTRQTWLQEQAWDLLILDEAQAIKNPSARQTKAVKSLKSCARIALTGTPVENRLGDLWSLFDFLSPGLLGSTSRFKNFIKQLATDEHSDYAPLRKLVQPYILRRLKTDKKIISDLPDKTEMMVACGLSKIQAKLYMHLVNELKDALENKDGIKRRGLVLAYLMRFKQLCNHPGQLIGDGDFTPAKSGKFLRLREICEEIASRQEKVLIFTQFREMTEPLSLFLTEVFGQPGLIFHGGTPVGQRKNRVEQFQAESGPPFFVLSLKAAGVGLNLTAANHVIHFDRWWNPAVENQATDRAFRIGQQRNVLVHKFVCRGTVEDKIDRLIADKVKLADDVLDAGGETILTELDDQALIDLVSINLEKTQI